MSKHARRSSRRSAKSWSASRCLGAVIALLFALGQAASFAHIALERHVLCAEHGVYEHGSFQHGSFQHGEHRFEDASDRNAAQGSCGVEEDLGAGECRVSVRPVHAIHDHDVCALAQMGLSSGIAVTLRPAHALKFAEPALPRERGEARLPARYPIFLLAPKHSPPTV